MFNFLSFLLSLFPFRINNYSTVKEDVIKNSRTERWIESKRRRKSNGRLTKKHKFTILLFYEWVWMGGKKIKITLLIIKYFPATLFTFCISGLSVFYVLLLSLFLFFEEKRLVFFRKIEQLVGLLFFLLEGVIVCWMVTMTFDGLVGIIQYGSRFLFPYRHRRNSLLENFLLENS